MGILRRAEISVVKGMCEVQLKYRKEAKDLMFGLSKTMDQLAMANSVRLCDLLLIGEDAHALRRALDIEVEGVGQNGG